MHGITLPQQGHIVNILPPQGISGGAISDVFAMTKSDHATIIIQLGATVGASVRVTVDECSSFVPAASTPIAFAYQEEEVSAGDTLRARDSATVAGLRISASTSTFAVIDVDGSQLTDGYPYLQVTFEDPGAPTIASAVAILTGTRYQQEITDTAIV